MSRANGTPPDPRTHAWRSDLADVRLQGQVPSERFVASTRGQIRTPFVPVYAAPQLDAKRVTEALAGEIVAVFERGQGWVWGQLERDRYVGYIPESAVMDQNTLAQVRMPNRNGFIVDDRPDTKAVRCMTNCK